MAAYGFILLFVLLVGAMLLIDIADASAKPGPFNGYCFISMSELKTKNLADKTELNERVKPAKASFITLNVIGCNPTKLVALNINTFWTIDNLEEAFYCFPAFQPNPAVIYNVGDKTYYNMENCNTDAEPVSPAKCQIVIKFTVRKLNADLGTSYLGKQYKAASEAQIQVINNRSPPELLYQGRNIDLFVATHKIFIDDCSDTTKLDTFAAALNKLFTGTADVMFVEKSFSVSVVPN